jgi:hypothetical protein
LLFNKEPIIKIKVGMNKIKQNDSFKKGFYMAKEEIINLIYDLQDELWGDRKGYNSEMRAQMEFCKELRKRLSSFSLDAISQKSVFHKD